MKPWKWTTIRRISRSGSITNIYWISLLQQTNRRSVSNSKTVRARPSCEYSPRATTTIVTSLCQCEFDAAEDLQRYTQYLVESFCINHNIGYPVERSPAKFPCRN